MNQKPLVIIDRFERYVCQFLLAFFVIIVFMQIILRFLHASLSWTEEISRYAFLWFILLGACYATRLSALNRVTMQFTRAPLWLINICLLIGDFIWLIFCLIMTWEGIKAVMDLREFTYFTPALNWDLSYIYLIFPLSFLLMAIRVIQVNYIKYILKEKIEDPDQQNIRESQKMLLSGKEESDR